MRFFLDENLPLCVLERLQRLGHPAEHARLTPLRGSDDRTIAEYAKKKEAILITKDLEFGNVLIYPKNSHYGLLILRLPYDFSATQIADSVEQFLKEIDPDHLKSLIVLELGKYRIRRL